MGSFLHNRGEVGNFIENTFFFFTVLRNKVAFSNLTQTAVPQKFNYANMKHLHLQLAKRIYRTAIVCKYCSTRSQ